MKININKLDEYYKAYKFNEQLLNSLKENIDLESVELSSYLSYVDRREELLTKVIEGDTFPFTPNVFHFFIREGNDIICPFTKESTKDLNLADEQKLFLMSAISYKYKHFFDDDITVDDIPLIYVLKDEFLRQHLGEDFGGDDKDILLCEYIWQEVKKAHVIDSGFKLQSIVHPIRHRSISEDRCKYLRSSLNNDRQKIKEAPPESRCLLNYICDVISYEIDFASGKSVNELYASIPKDDYGYQLEALTKAYYNFSNQEFRANSPYFLFRKNAYLVDFRTANQEINKKILSMKKRNN